MLPMNSIGQLAALIAALIHVAIFAMESIFFSRPAIRSRFLVEADDVAVARPWAFNQGFYNLFLAIGCFIGLILLHTGPASAGRALVALTCGSMLAAALLLIGSNRRMARAAALQGLLPLIALILLVA
jgi:putative membrane protein